MLSIKSSRNNKVIKKNHLNSLHLGYGISTYVDINPENITESMDRKFG